MNDKELLDTSYALRNFDYQIHSDGSFLEVFSISPIFQVHLIDSCGKVMFEGKRLNKNKFRLKKGVFNRLLIPLLIAIRFADGVVYEKFTP